MNYSLRNLRGDLLGGITASVVALPLALAFGVASGLGPLAGLYGAISVGFFAAVFGGTRSQISGPTGPMAIAMAVIVASHADRLTEALTIVVMAGLMQVLFGALRIGRFITYTPYSVISGFMSGIGVIIIFVQILPLLGHEVASSVPSSLLALPELMSSINFDALMIGTVTLLTGVFWPKPLRQVLPPALVAMTAGLLASLLWRGAPIIGEVPSGLPDLQWPVLSLAFLTQALQPALILALIGSIDSLLTSLIADSLTRGQHNPDRELVGQGIGNMVSGLVGGMPGAGAPVGTVVNIRGGGRSRVSGILCASILLAMVLGFGQFVEQVPHAVLAGIMIKVGWDIIDWRFLTCIHRVRPVYLLLALMTLVLTVFVDLVIAVTIGFIAAGLVGSRHLERLQLDNVVSLPFLDRSFLATSSEADEADPFAARVGLVALRGYFSVASSNKLVRTIGADIRDHEVVVFDFSETTYLDESAAMVVGQMLDIAIDENTEVLVMGLSGTVADHLFALDVFRDLPEDRFVVALDEAKVRSRSLLEG